MEKIQTLFNLRPTFVGPQIITWVILSQLQIKFVIKLVLGISQHLREKMHSTHISYVV